MGAPKIKPISFFDEAIGISFIDAAKKVIETYANAQASKTENHRIARNLEVEYEAGGMITFEADGRKVQMMLAFKKEVLLFIFEKMLSTVVTEIDAEVQDCCGELTNIIYGYAKAPLVNSGHQFSMATPKSTLDVNAHLKNLSSLEIPFKINGLEHGFSLILST